MKGIKSNQIIKLGDLVCLSYDSADFLGMGIVIDFSPIPNGCKVYWFKTSQTSVEDYNHLILWETRLTNYVYDFIL